MTKHQSSRKNKNEKASKKVHKMDHSFSLKMSAGSIFCRDKGESVLKAKGGSVEQSTAAKRMTDASRNM